MKKITDLTETKFITKYTKDEFENRERDAEEVTFNRKVELLGSGERITNSIIDAILIHIIFAFKNW